MASLVANSEYVLLVICNCVLSMVQNVSSSSEDATESSKFPTKYNFTINHSNSCHKSPFLVTFVTSTVDHFDQRSAIRETWGNKELQKKYNTKLYYLVGIPQDGQNKEKLLTKLQKEDWQFQDIIQVAITDTYENLPVKSVAMLQWMFTYCNHGNSAKFLFKTDDDMFIHMENLLRDLKYTIHNHFIMGHIIAGAGPIRDKKSKYYTPVTVYKDDIYPTYISGTGYVISSDLVTNLYTAALKTPLFWLEDIYITGMCAKVADAEHIFNGKFGYIKRDFDPCVYKDIITGHEMGMEEMRTMWKDIHDTSMDCSLPPIDS